MPEPVDEPAALDAPRVVLAFDFGQRRIGVASGDTVSHTAAPQGALASGAGGPPWEAIDALLREWQPGLIVIGLPYNVDGSESAQTGAVREFAAEFARRHAPLQVAMMDERYSSREAAARLKAARESGLRRRRVSKADVDAAAACVILERWFTQGTRR